MVDLAKGDMWRNDSIGEGTFSHAVRKSYHQFLHLVKFIIRVMVIHG